MWGVEKRLSGRPPRTRYCFLVESSRLLHRRRNTTKRSIPRDKEGENKKKYEAKHKKKKRKSHSIHPQKQSFPSLLQSRARDLVTLLVGATFFLLSSSTVSRLRKCYTTAAALPLSRPPCVNKKNKRNQTELPGLGVCTYLVHLYQVSHNSYLKYTNTSTIIYRVPRTRCIFHLVPTSRALIIRHAVILSSCIYSYILRGT